MRPARISMINGLFHITTRCDNKNFYFRVDEDFIEYLNYTHTVSPVTMYTVCGIPSSE
ncbi:hypothetical protein [Candidatus Uabimicrobium amorphum]|uniref:Uncharacterized protein n=1 Tax=Uabimicrobium amorphum TaxID=2596890 RepID=A0A5S9IS88_UABAM|nr:hypothetical protein [Candidatus Uabimicrobium amorphum]BBM86590.1 hypothetical protein UABAM_04976 [Candidatus Uabimicrobium amorphum]